MSRAAPIAAAPTAVARAARCLAATLALGLFGSGCMEPWDSAWDLDTGAGVQRVSGSILASTVWTADTTWVLDDTVYVEPGVQLTIEPGTVVQGTAGSALVVTRGATLLARGNRDAPITFTSAEPEGERARGDWGGVVLLGAAPVNEPDAAIEGVPEGLSQGFYGGSDPDHNCGVLEYVRIQFAGFEVFTNNDFNGLTVGGCGRNTILRYLHVHNGADDGVEFFGGTADARYVLVTGVKDDSIDYDFGWTGRVQFLIAQQAPGWGDHGIEADNNELDFDAEPITSPTLYNLTLVGSGDPDTAQTGLLLRRGTAGTLRNLAVVGFTTSALDVRDAETARRFDEGLADLTHSVFHAIGDGGSAWFGDESGDGDDDGGFDEEAFFTAGVRENRFGTNPMFDADGPYDLADPDFVPREGSPLATGATRPPEGEFWDEAATYVGAVRPGDPAPWYAGWTAFPAN